MRVFLAGGSGVIGRRLVPQLVAAGHQVTATTRRPEKAELVSSLGATPAVLDALDEGAVMAAVRAAAPEVVMNQLTELPQRYDPRRLGPWYERTSRLRVDGTRNLLAACRAVGATRFVYQSIAFMYAYSGPPVVDEDAPVATDAPEPFGAAVRATVEGERLTLEAEGMVGVVLRYGQLYGPGTYYAADGSFARQARRRGVPIVGGGSGVFSFLHVDDAASAAVCAMTMGRGVYNVVDDDPAPARDWIPVFARAVHAPRPLRVPGWLVRLIVGSGPVATLTDGRGASNARAKRDLGWEPSHPTWREGFLLAG
jgi:nucleoside-diphosphate-sugar epimerase